MGKLSDLRERRIFEILVGYAATGWIALQVVDQLVDRAIFPDVAYTVALIWYVGGFFASAIVGWYHGEKGRQTAPPREIALLGLVAFVVLLASAAPIRDHRARRQASAAARESSMDLRRLAVRYFDDASGDGSYRHLAGGLTEDLIDRLGAIRTLDVVSADAVARFRGKPDVGADSVARALEAGTVVDGTLAVVGGRAQGSVRLLDGESGAEISRADLERVLPELLQFQEELAGEVVALLEQWLDEPVELPRRETGATDVEAWILVQRAERARREMARAVKEEEYDDARAAHARVEDLLEEAASLDPRWAEPPTRRAWAAGGRAALEDDAVEVQRWLREGETYANRALSRSPNDAAALEARGTLRYRIWLRTARDTAEDDALLQDARSDLERAVAIDPSLASAHGTLSRLYARALHDISRASVAASKAYEEDPYLESADDIVWRLFRYSWHLRQLRQARRWCREGQRRFRSDERFLRCRLDLMTTSAVEPAVEDAWRLVERIDSLAAGEEEAREVLGARIVAAGVVARAGLPDSARAVLGRTRVLAGTIQDSRHELLALEAEIRSRVLGDAQGAQELLDRYRAANPDRPLSTEGWWWGDLDDPSG